MGTTVPVPTAVHERLRIFTWHVHGNYLYYLSRGRHEFFIPRSDDDRPGYHGLGQSFPFGSNVHEIAERDVHNTNFDLVLFQSARNYEIDQFETLSPAQRLLPSVFLEHDCPRSSPTETRHPLDDPAVLLVHVTPFNALMWDSGALSVRVVEHGVCIPEGVRYTGEIPRGLVVVNNLSERGRRVGADIVSALSQQLPLDLVGMGTEGCGGLGEIPPMELASFAARYRFFLHPMRWTSLGLAVCEAMAIGMPILGIAATELPGIVQNGREGFIDTSPERLVPHGLRLLADRAEAVRLGENARRRALERFAMPRFQADWDRAFRDAIALSAPRLQEAAT